MNSITGGITLAWSPCSDYWTGGYTHAQYTEKLFLCGCFNSEMPQRNNPQCKICLNQRNTHNFHKYLRDSSAMTCTSACRDKKIIDNKRRLYLPETTNTRKCTWRIVATKNNIYEVSCCRDSKNWVTKTWDAQATMKSWKRNKRKRTKIIRQHAKKYAKPPVWKKNETRNPKKNRETQRKKNKNLTTQQTNGLKRALHGLPTKGKCYLKHRRSLEQQITYSAALTAGSAGESGALSDARRRLSGRRGDRRRRKTLFGPKIAGGGWQQAVSRKLNVVP